MNRTLLPASSAKAPNFIQSLECFPRSYRRFNKGTAAPLPSNEPYVQPHQRPADIRKPSITWISRALRHSQLSVHFDHQLDTGSKHKPPPISTLDMVDDERNDRRRRPTEQAACPQPNPAGSSTNPTHIKSGISR